MLYNAVIKVIMPEVLSYFAKESSLLGVDWLIILQHM